MKKNELKLFVGGYYDERMFVGSHFDGKTPFGKDVNTYTLEETLKLGFVESIKDLSKEDLIDLYEKVYNKDLVEELKKRGILEEDKEDLFFFDFDDFTDEEKKDLILNWTSTDEIAGLEYFNTVEEAEKYKNEVLEEIKDAEDNSVYNGQIQDNYGYFREMYVYKDDLEEYENKN